MVGTHPPLVREAKNVDVVFDEVVSFYADINSKRKIADKLV